MSMIITGFTPLNNQQCILSETRIDIWQFSLAHDVSGWEHVLNNQEQIQGNRFYFEKHRRRFKIARAAVRIILGRYLNTSPECLNFVLGPHGKPSVVNSQKAQFNLSHSGEMGIVAIGKIHPIGIDIERFSARPYEGLAQRFFSESEFKEFHKAPAALKPILFFHIWSQKEAFIKASGLGLSYPTKAFSVPTTLPTKQLVNDPLHNSTWQLRSFMPQVAYSGALCYHPKVREIRYGMLPFYQAQTL